MQTMTKSRTQRRLEKKQAIFLLALVLLASLCSFVLGIMVGRSGAERDALAQLRQQQEVTQIVKAPVVKAVPEAEAEAVVEPPPPPPEPQSVDPPKLTFYEDLSRDAAPLGSGINQQPPAADPAPIPSEPPLDLPEQPVVVGQSATRQSPAAGPSSPATPDLEPVAAAPADQPESLPAVVKQGTHAVQIGSFAAVKDAAALRQDMLDKGYPAFLVEANLGDRGLWYRVRIGPYADADQAALVRNILDSKEQIEGFVTRHQP